MPYVKIYIHFVWSTKDRRPLLTTPELREEVWCHIRDNASKKGIFIDTVGGYQEHCHCTVSLGPQQTVSTIMQLIKGESCYWINKYNLTKRNFEWQDEYYAVSVSPGDMPAVRQYIISQENHHQHRTFQEEFDSYLQEWGFQRFKDGSIRPLDLE